VDITHVKVEMYASGATKMPGPGTLELHEQGSATLIRPQAPGRPSRILEEGGNDSDAVQVLAVRQVFRQEE